MSWNLVITILVVLAAVVLYLTRVFGLLRGPLEKAPLCSEDGWCWSHPLPQGNSLHAVCSMSADVAWAVGDEGTVLKTTDGGQNWGRQVSGYNQ